MSWIKWQWRDSDDKFLENLYAFTKDLKVLERNTKFYDETLPDPQADEKSWIIPEATGPLMTELDYRIQMGSKVLNIPNTRITRRKPLTKEQRNVILELSSKKCTECESSKALDIHHIDQDPSNNSLENLTVLCRDCHQKKHRKKEVVQS